VAARLLDEWEAAVGEFTAVVPREYKAALAKAAAEQQAEMAVTHA
jgi:glutamate synthase domain-containing protein 3